MNTKTKDIFLLNHQKYCLSKFLIIKMSFALKYPLVGKGCVTLPGGTQTNVYSPQRRPWWQTDGRYHPPKSVLITSALIEIIYGRMGEEGHSQAHGWLKGGCFTRSFSQSGWQLTNPASLELPEELADNSTQESHFLQQQLVAYEEGPHEARNFDLPEPRQFPPLPGSCTTQW